MEISPIERAAPGALRFPPHRGRVAPGHRQTRAEDAEIAALPVMPGVSYVVYESALELKVRVGYSINAAGKVTLVSLWTSPHNTSLAFSTEAIQKFRHEVADEVCDHYELSRGVAA